MQEKNPRCLCHEEHDECLHILSGVIQDRETDCLIRSYAHASLWTRYKIQDILFVLPCVQLRTCRTIHTYTHTYSHWKVLCSFSAHQYRQCQVSCSCQQFIFYWQHIHLLIMICCITRGKKHVRAQGGELHSTYVQANYCDKNKHKLMMNT